MRPDERQGRFVTIFLMIILCTASAFSVTITGELKQWHRVTLTFDGPETSELDVQNPFLNYRLNVTFLNGDSKYVIPGFFAADGNAAETSATSGNKWCAHFTPDRTGDWSYTVSFRTGKAIAISDDPDAGEATDFDGASGTIAIAKSDKSGRDFRSRGKLAYIGERYLQHAGNRKYFLKAGADSPENFLGYIDFDGTYYGGNSKRRTGKDVPYGGLHNYTPHLKDWRAGDPTWKDGKGKGMIGALNYLASKGMNSVYFLTMNVMGDGEDVWPWTDYNERYRFDCSKLDQWEIVFSHMDKLGIMLHVVTQETENESMLDIGKTGTQRKLYYRELVARFAHHLAITWNLGEENGIAPWTPHGQDEAMQKAMADYLNKIDPYNNPIVLHTHNKKPGRDRIITPLLAHPTIHGLSLQIHDPRHVPDVTLDWIQQSSEAGKKWVVSLDEIGPANRGVVPDADDYHHDEVRKYALWGHLMAGGAGVEWYFGYKFAHNDLNSEDWGSRDHMWDLTRYAVEFFHTHLPFHQMQADNDLISAKNAYCFAKEGEIYAIYLREGGSTDLDLKESRQKFSVRWYNPRTGGKLQKGTVTHVKGPGRVDLGNAKKDKYMDWVILVAKD